MTDPYKQLASLWDQRVAQYTQRTTNNLAAELGTITPSLALKLDGFKHEIQDYNLADWQMKLTLPSLTLQGTTSGLQDSIGGSVSGQAQFAFGEAIIEEVRLEMKGQLKAGDRVLAIPIKGGQEAVVICKVVK